MSSNLNLPFRQGLATDNGYVFEIDNNLQPDQSNADTSQVSSVVGRAVFTHGVHGVNGKGSGGKPSLGTGVWGESDGGFGLYAESGTWEAIFGKGKNGVHGQSSSKTDSGVWGENTAAGYGVSGSSATGVGVYGRGGQYAGKFDGEVSVSGSMAVDQQNANDGAFNNGSPAGTGIAFGTGSGEGIASKRTPGGNQYGLDFYTNFTPRVSVTNDGNVNAGGALTAGSITTPGNVNAHDVVLSGGDLAEDFGLAESAAFVGPGTVMVVDEQGDLAESRQAYDRKVAGVVSVGGGLEPGIVLDRKPRQSRSISMAMVGKVYCKVDARYSPIEVGDLLTTSPTPGHAMKATDPHSAFGSVIGKALYRMDSGRGLIPILVALQ